MDNLSSKKTKSKKPAAYKHWLPVAIPLLILFMFISVGMVACSPSTPDSPSVPATDATPTTRPPRLSTLTAALPTTLRASPTSGQAAAASSTPQPAFTNSPAESSTPTLPAGSTWVRPADGMTMVYVPAGEFSMGMVADATLALCRRFYSDCQRNWFTNAEPVHTVFLDGFWIDQTEVTNAMYARCVQAGACQPPETNASYERFDYYGYPKYAAYPVVYVSWFDAETYCEWAGGRLPSEAEWEKAARGTEAYDYPWGDVDPTCELANIDPDGHFACEDDTNAVGSYPDGASPYGALDMAGNVWEWVADWYDSNYYANSPSSNPAGPASGDIRSMRGGGFYVMGYGVLSASRQVGVPESTSEYSGFRCVLASP